MIDFSNAVFVKMTPVNIKIFGHQVQPLLIPGEEIDTAFVTLHEGKYHQIKRMFAARGKPVIYLKRISMGGVSLDTDLLEGEYRYLTAEELQILCKSERI